MPPPASSPSSPSTSPAPSPGSPAPAPRRCWYVADAHFGHENVIPFCGRPFRSAAHMDAALMENLWAKVGPEDALWVVGDFAFGPRAKDEAWLAGLFGQLPGAERHLVRGNHDHAPTLALPWDGVHDLALVDDPARPKGAPPPVLCHYPMMTWPGARRGALHLFGHVHLGLRAARGMVNVGVDQWEYGPASFDEAARRAAKLPPHALWGEVEHGAEG